MTDRHARKLTYASADLSDPDSIELYGKQLEGMTFQDVLDLGIVPEGVDREYNSRRYKGGMGTLVEERFYGYRANSDERPDFPDAGVELKTTCYDVKQNGDFSAGERLVLTMVSYDKPIEEDFFSSHLWAKSSNIMLIYYERDRDIDPYEQKVRYASLFTPPEEDLKIIQDDYEKIVGLIEAGKAEELSESLTTYLGACTKGATEATMWVRQYYPPHTEAKKRAFCFKRQYMDYVLHHYIMGQPEDVENIIKNPEALDNQTFEEYVAAIIDKNEGKTDRELCKTLGMEYTGNKAQWTRITYALLGIHGDRAEEFEKANISVRTIRVQEDGASIKESISLDTFRFLDLVKEDWGESKLHAYLDETRFLFVVFQKKGGGSVLRGCMFWSIPQSDLEGPIKECWERTRSAATKGLVLKPEVDRNGHVSYSNNLPNKSDGLLCHVRPHTSHAAYRFEDETEVGSIERDGDELPDGRWITRQSFWLNSDYVYAVIEEAGL